MKQFIKWQNYLGKKVLRQWKTTVKFWTAAAQHQPKMQSFQGTVEQPLQPLS